MKKYSVGASRLPAVLGAIEGIDDVLGFLDTYKGKLPDVIERLKFLVETGEWKLADLVAAAAAEEEAVSRELLQQRQRRSRVNW